MSRLTDLIAQAKSKDADLGRELEREFKALASRRSFGLNFERHTPESVELPGRPIRKGDKVRVLPPRGSTEKGDKRLWKVTGTTKADGKRVAQLDLIGAETAETQTVPVDDLIVVAEFRDYIYPGLVSTGKVERCGDKPFHTVINGENFHALEALTFTHRGKVDVIYIDPPYNTGAKDWKYNNDYVEGDDLYRHSKWLAFMERRLKIARTLLKPECAVLIATIDEKEFLRLGMLLEQTFPEAQVQMVSSVINPSGAARTSAFRRTDEYIFFVFLGGAGPAELPLPVEWRITKDSRAEKLRWDGLLRSGSHTQREDRPNQFYPIYAHLIDGTPLIHSIGETFFGDDHRKEGCPDGTVAIWPIRSNGSQGNWQVGAESARNLLAQGYLKLGKWRGADTAVSYIKRGGIAKIEAGIFPVVDRDKDGSVIVDDSEYSSQFIPGTQWRLPSHSAEQGGTKLLRALLPDRKFPFPKSLFAVEDAIRFFAAKNQTATVLDFFSGSGTTSHAVMRLNRQDGGRRQCISVTNNEVSADEQVALRKSGLRPGDAEWEKWGICDYITKPRIKAAITGQTPDGKPIKGDYKFTDEFPMADGFEENAEFFTLTYETPVSISHNRAFARIAPLLWMRAGSEGRRIDALPEAGWAVADTYGLLTDLDAAAPFVDAVEAKGGIRIAYIVTDDDRRFQSVAQRLPDGVEAVRLYESYLTNFRFSMGR
ncbi:site-specific DNA-methyltransferase [Sulfitobacter sp. BDSS02]|nr:site-specific DNA-methyltransferase [Sulfitobacter sp. BDSS02]MBR9848599.1 site-specific DNA-methyltransferase [Paracoccaceae bacterium]